RGVHQPNGYLAFCRRKRRFWGGSQRASGSVHWAKPRGPHSFPKSLVKGSSLVRERSPLNWRGAREERRCFRLAMSSGRWRCSSQKFVLAHLSARASRGFRPQGRLGYAAHAALNHDSSFTDSRDKRCHTQSSNKVETWIAFSCSCATARATGT